MNFRRSGFFPPLLALLAMSGLAGCGSDRAAPYKEYGQAVGQAFQSLFTPSSVPRSAVADIPYASMGYRVNGGDEAILILATSSPEYQLWTASSHVVFQTSNGRIQRTVGLPQDLGGMAPERGNALPSPAAALAAPFSSRRLADFPQSNAYGILIACTAAARGTATISLLGQSLATQRVDESCESRSLNWRFTDTYWIDPKSGLVWRSLQHLTPQGETVETEIFRPPG
jgi:hypothetical protein